ILNMEFDESNFFLDENYIIESNISEIIDIDMSDNYSNPEENITEDDEASKNTPIEENTNTETDNKNKLKSIVHNHFTLDQQAKKYKSKDKSTSALKRHLERNHKRLIAKEKIIGALDKLNNEAKIPSADTISNRISKIFSNEQANLKKQFQEISSKISFTLDCWTSKNQKSYLGATAHWISNNWQLQHCTIEFSYFEGSHSGKNLAE
ncbi:30010_t:CDS:2, partial [Gigaspora margarita]